MLTRGSIFTAGRSLPDAGHLDLQNAQETLLENARHTVILLEQLSKAVGDLFADMQDGLSSANVQRRIVSLRERIAIAQKRLEQLCAEQQGLDAVGLSCDLQHCTYIFTRPQIVSHSYMRGPRRFLSSLDRGAFQGLYHSSYAPRQNWLPQLFGWSNSSDPSLPRVEPVRHTRSSRAHPVPVVLTYMHSI